MKVSLTNEMKDKIVYLREELNLTSPEIGRRIGTSRGAVDWYCLMNGIRSYGKNGNQRKLSTVRKTVIRNGHIVRPYTAEEDKIIIEMDMQGARYAHIAKRLGRQRNSVWARLATLARHEEYGLR